MVEMNGLKTGDGEVLKKRRLDSENMSGNVEKSSDFDMIVAYQSASFLFTSFSKALSGWAKGKGPQTIKKGEKEEKPSSGEKEKDPGVKENFRVVGLGFFLELCEIMGLGESAWTNDNTKLGLGLEAISAMIPGTLHTNAIRETETETKKKQKYRHIGNMQIVLMFTFFLLLLGLLSHKIYSPTDDVITTFTVAKDENSKPRVSVSSLVLHWANKYTFPFSKKKKKY